MITGNACINYLSDKQQSKDKASSSYWNKYHEGFQFDGKKFDGLKLLGHYLNYALGINLIIILLAFLS